MESNEMIIEKYPVLGEKECGTGRYVLYVQCIQKEGQYMIMFKSEDYKELNQTAQQINEARYLIYKNRKDKENIEAFVL
jgi:hypothetical protein